MTLAKLAFGYTRGQLILKIAGRVAAILLLLSPDFAGAAEPAPAAPASPTTIQELDRQLAALLAKDHIPGGTLVIIENGQVTFAKGYGYADLARRIPATPDTPFRAGSISKAITSIAVMTLVERGRLSLDAPVAGLLPEVRFINPWESTDPVRLANVLEHTTGWSDIGPHLLVKDETWSGLRGVQAASPSFVSRWKPGYFTSYDNAGPAVAALAVEKVSGQDFEAYARDAVLRPMGMATADFDLTPDLAARIAKSYDRHGAVSPYQHIVLRPAGSLNVSARELAQLVRFYIGRGAVDGRRILSPDSVARIEHGQTNLGARFGFTAAYGLGNLPFPDSGITFHGHSGQIDSFSSVIGYTLRNGSGYVLMANGGEGVEYAEPAAHLIQIYLTRGLPLNPPPTIKLSQADLQRYAGLYRPVTLRNAILTPYFQTFSLDRVKAGDGKLVLDGHDYWPVGPHSFRRSERENASLAFVEDGGRTYKLSALGAEAKEPLWRIGAIWGVALLILLATVFGLIMLIPWSIAQARGRLATRGGLAMRLVPFAGLAALIVNVLLPLKSFAGMSVSGLRPLAVVGPDSLTIFACSLLYPLCGVIGLLLTVRVRGAAWPIRLYAGLTSLALLCVAGYAVTIGWFAMRTWTM